MEDGCKRLHEEALMEGISVRGLSLDEIERELRLERSGQGLVDHAMQEQRMSERMNRRW